MNSAPQIYRRRLKEFALPACKPEWRVQKLPKDLRTSEWLVTYASRARFPYVGPTRVIGLRALREPKANSQYRLWFPSRFTIQQAS